MSSEEIREAREALGLTQTEFGEMLHVTLKTVQNWEYGRRKMLKLTQKLLQKKLEEKGLQIPGANRFS
ncbi:helix-turn-helix protein [Nitrosospira multiformis]|jgi:DNA-binding transcriptional regulator YiaG|uniref:Helix-turn-helix protein n=1 Tax=Nitrosospira multiformis TaxID=1231 RepID=A0A2T5I6W9_9PROT|nr:helix-turn-helix domain-containing protein [Nitrosospira multiformis]PTQ79575.1 helix-turn-helix protein [Nitrosospira multiformis]